MLFVKSPEETARLANLHARLLEESKLTVKVHPGYLQKK
jgi:hypothetical protein